MLGPVGGNAQQHIGAEHIEQKYDVKEAGKVEHGCGCGCGYILHEYKKNIVLLKCLINVLHYDFFFIVIL